MGFLLDVFLDFLRKTAYAGRLFITFIGLHKQRRHHFLTILIGVSIFLFFPLVITVIIISSILLAPLSPLFTLPIFLVAFPRTQRFWPSLVDFGRVYLKTDDTVYYQQAEPEIAKSMCRCIARGSVSSQPGTQVLLRFDNRLALVTILEKDYGSCVINLRGLELQETSCHSEEATAVDNMYERLHNQNSRSVSCLNGNILSTLLPTDTSVIQTYSDARNILTGIIDQPGALQKFSENLRKILVWVFYRYSVVVGMPIAEFTAGVTHDSAELEVNDVKNQAEATNSEPYTVDHIIAELDIVSTVAQIEKFNTKAFRVDTCTGFKSPKDDNLSWVSISDSNDIQEVTEYQNAAWTEPVMHGFIPVDVPVNPSEGNVQILGKSEKPHPFYSSSGVLSPLSGRIYPDKTRASPEDWPKSFLTQLEEDVLMKSFPKEWYSYLTESKSCLGIYEYKWLCGVVLSCFSALNNCLCPLSSSPYQTHQVTPLDIKNGFHGEFPNSSQMSCMRRNPEMLCLALKAYRYCFRSFI